MIQRILEAWHADGNPLDQYAVYTGWGMDFSSRDILELEKFVTLMQPFNVLFSQLNGDRQSTIHLVYPTVQVNLGL